MAFFFEDDCRSFFLPVHGWCSRQGLEDGNEMIVTHGRRLHGGGAEPVRFVETIVYITDSLIGFVFPLWYHFGLF
jgi:hypothetical protein